MPARQSWCDWMDRASASECGFNLHLAESGMHRETRVGVGQEHVSVWAPEGIVQLGEDLCAGGWGEDVLA